MNKDNLVETIQNNWNLDSEKAIFLEKIFEIHEIQNQIHCELDSTPKNNLNDRKKIQRWIDQLDFFLTNFDKVKQKIPQRIETTTKFSINENYVCLALFQSSIVDPFEKMIDHNKWINPEHPQRDQLNAIVKTFRIAANNAKKLAWLGDTSLSFVLLSQIGNKEISDIGSLTEFRKTIVQNETLEHLCNEWYLWDYRFCLKQKDPANPVEFNNQKGTLVEAILGIYLIEGKIEAIENTIRYLENHKKKND